MDKKPEIALLIQRGAWDRAEQLCQAEILNHPTDPQVWFYTGAVQSAQGRRIEAIRSLKVAASHIDTASGELATGDHETLLKIAQALLNLRAYKEALSVFEQLDFALPQVVLGLGRCHWGLGRYHRALTHFTGLWEARPTWPDLGLTYARALCSVDFYEQAGNVLQALLKQPEVSPEVMHQYTLWLLSCKDEDTARSWLAQQQESTPSEKLSLLRRALNTYDDGQVATDLPWLNIRQQSQWESYITFKAMPGTPRWFGDNTSLLKYTVTQMPETGIVVECGVFHGRSINLLALWSQRTCHGFDSFSGLPEAWSQQEQAGAYTTQGQLPRVPDNVTLHTGWFKETLPSFVNGLDQPIALLHVDCDLYSSTVTVLEHLLPYLVVGSVIVFDDLGGYPEWREHEYRAWMECVNQHGLSYELIGGVMLGRAAAVKLTKR